MGGPGTRRRRKRWRSGRRIGRLRRFVGRVLVGLGVVLAVVWVVSGWFDFYRVWNEAGVATPGGSAVVIGPGRGGTWLAGVRFGGIAVNRYRYMTLTPGFVAARREQSFRNGWFKYDTYTGLGQTEFWIYAPLWPVALGSIVVGVLLVRWGMFAHDRRGTVRVLRIRPARTCDERGVSGVRGGGRGGSGRAEVGRWKYAGMMRRMVHRRRKRRIGGWALIVFGVTIAGLSAWSRGRDWSISGDGHGYEGSVSVTSGVLQVQVLAGDWIETADVYPTRWPISRGPWKWATSFHAVQAEHRWWGWAWFRNVQPKGSNTFFAAPLWAPAVVSAACGALLVRIGRQRPAGVCTRCGYDLRGLGKRAACPECGEGRAQ
ncbi:MAG: hypothetical protein QM783_19490 [Phycisphaerales bacterium]